MRKWLVVAGMVLGCGAAGAQAAGTQQQQPVQPVIIGVPMMTNDPERARQEHQRDQRMVDERRKRLVGDTEKLLALATQLKAAVDASSKNELSLEVVRKAAEIEKLAHEVKDRMRN